MYAIRSYYEGDRFALAGGKIEGQQVLHPAFEIHPGEGQQLATGIAIGARHLDAVAQHRRITSYNVCYTKLLRIAQECGFQSPSRFSLRFRQRFGMSPKALRVITSYSIHYTKLYETVRWNTRTAWATARSSGRASCKG